MIPINFITITSTNNMLNKIPYAAALLATAALAEQELEVNLDAR